MCLIYLVTERYYIKKRFINKTTLNMTHLIFIVLSAAYYISKYPILDVLMICQYTGCYVTKLHNVKLNIRIIYQYCTADITTIRCARVVKNRRTITQF